MFTMIFIAFIAIVLFIPLLASLGHEPITMQIERISIPPPPPLPQTKNNEMIYKIELTENEIDVVIKALGNRSFQMNDKIDDSSEYCVVDGWELGTKIFNQKVSHKNSQQVDDNFWDFTKELSNEERKKSFKEDGLSDE